MAIYDYFNEPEAMSDNSMEPEITEVVVSSHTRKNKTKREDKLEGLPARIFDHTIDPEKLKNKIRAELKTMYSEAGLSFGDKNEEVYLTFDGKAEFLKRLFTELLNTCFEQEPVFFENDQEKGAFAHLLKLESEKTELIRKCFSVDCSFEGISISSGIGVERTFPYNSPRIGRIEVVRHGVVHRSKLYYLRARTGKAAKIKERIVTK